MRTLLDIIESAKSGNIPTHEECYWAMLVYNALQGIDQRALMRLAKKPSKIITAEFQWKESFKRLKNALGKDPKTYMGSHDPSRPEYQKMRGIALTLFNKVMEGEGEE